MEQVCFELENLEIPNHAKQLTLQLYHFSNPWKSLWNMHGESRYGQLHEVLQALIGGSRGLEGLDWRGQSDQGAVTAVAHYGVSQQIPFHPVLVGDAAPTLFEPVVHQLPLLAALDRDSIHDEALAVAQCHRLAGQSGDQPAAAGDADLR